MSRNRVLLALAITGCTVILVTAVGGRPSLTAAPAPAHRIVGSWVNVLKVSGLPALPSLVTFTSDGIFLWSGPFGSTSGGHGVWTSTGDRTLTGTFMYLRRNAGGDFTGTVKSRFKATLNATYDQAAGSGKADFFDAQGKMVRSVDYTVDGTRIKVESP